MKKKSLFYLLLLGLCLGTAFFVSLTVGPVQVPFTACCQILVSAISHGPSAAPELPQEWADIVLKIRLPRLLLGLLVGACLGTAGAVYQSLLGNPLADPYTLGISSGAALGATIAFFLGGLVQSELLKFLLFGPYTVPLWAFAGALLTLFLLYLLARVSGKLPAVTLLLAGVMVSAFFSALILLLVCLGNRQMEEIFFWLIGSLSTVDFSLLKVAWVYSLLCFILIYACAKDLNALSLGEEKAVHLGVAVEKVKTFLFVVVSLMVGACVSLSGLIGFVGLLVPHALRVLVGADHRVLLPACALGGGFFLICADTLARTMTAPTELPVGVMTALLGAPFFLYLLRKSRKLH